MNNQKQEKQEPATGSKHLLAGMKIAIPVLFSIDLYISDDARSCVNDDWRIDACLRKGHT